MALAGKQTHCEANYDCIKISLGSTRLGSSHQGSHGRCRCRWQVRVRVRDRGALDFIANTPRCRTALG